MTDSENHNDGECRLSHLSEATSTHLSQSPTAKWIDQNEITTYEISTCYDGKSFHKSKISSTLI